jgi:hypothetical protein
MVVTGTWYVRYLIVVHLRRVGRACKTQTVTSPGDYQVSLSERYFDNHYDTNMDVILSLNHDHSRTP